MHKYVLALLFAMSFSCGHKEEPKKKEPCHCSECQCDLEGHCVCDKCDCGCSNADDSRSHNDDSGGGCDGGSCNHE